MDFEIPDKMKVVIEMINEFVDKEIIPLERDGSFKDF